MFSGKIVKRPNRRTPDTILFVNDFIDEVQDYYDFDLHSIKKDWIELIDYHGLSLTEALETLLTIKFKDKN